MSILNRRLTPALLACLFLVACGPGNDKPNAPAGFPTSNLAESYWMGSPPGNAQDVKAIRTAGNTGDDVVVVGRVSYFTDKRAQFKLVDRSFVPCSDRPEDSCTEPWDYCCEDITQLNEGTVIVRFLDESGGLQKTPAQGFHGLDHLQTVTVKGKVMKDDAGNMIVAAEAINIKP